MPKRYRSPDGLDWRDPDMPVLCRTTDNRTVEVGAFDMSYVCQHRLYNLWQVPWKSDPTYAMGPKKLTVTEIVDNLEDKCRNEKKPEQQKPRKKSESRKPSKSRSPAR